jgi:hypothetical protein
VILVNGWHELPHPLHQTSDFGEWMAWILYEFIATGLTLID